MSWRWLALGCAACAPDFDVRQSRVESERLLAVVAEPAEARPGELVTYTLFAADAAGPLEDPGLSASYCTAPKPLTENGSVAAECVARGGDLLESESGGRVRGAVPSDACRVHGPDPPPGDARPRDPDGTGGYYQPLRLAGFDPVAFHLQRIQCSPGDVAAEVARDFSELYRPNQNPAPVWFEPVIVAAVTELSVAWAEQAREEYAFVDRARQLVTTRRESLTVDWFATAGALAVDRQVIDGASAQGFVRNEYRPPAAGAAHVWAVVHDARGGCVLLHQSIALP